VPATSASPPPNPTPLARVALPEAEVEKSILMGMSMLEQLPRFGSDPALEGALPQEGAAPPPPVMKAPGSTARAGADTAKEAGPEDPSAQMGATIGGRS
jgi:hypothetical protein